MEREAGLHWCVGSACGHLCVEERGCICRLADASLSHCSLTACGVFDQTSSLAELTLDVVELIINEKHVLVSYIMKPTCGNAGHCDFEFVQRIDAVAVH